MSATLIAEQVLTALRQELIANKNSMPLHDVINLSQALLQVESSPRPDVQLELALIGAQLQRNGHHARPVVSEAHISATQPPLTISEPAKRPPVRKVVDKPTEQKTPRVEEAPMVITKPEGVEQTDMSPECWTQLLSNLRQTHNTLYSILRMSQLNLESLTEKQITLQFKFPFHQKRMSESKNKAVILEGLAALGVTGYELNCALIPKQKTEELREVELEPFTYEAPKPEDNPLLSQIRNVFGGAEVLE